MTTKAEERNVSGETADRETIVLWAGILIAPAAYFFQLLTAYALVHWTCAGGPSFIIHLVTIVALALCVLGGYIAWRSRENGRPDESDDLRVTGSRIQFMSIAGMVLSALFFFGILAQEIPTWILGPCVGRGATI